MSNVHNKYALYQYGRLSQWQPSSVLLKETSPLFFKQCEGQIVVFQMQVFK